MPKQTKNFIQIEKEKLMTNEEQKQELHKLIDNLDWDKFNDIFPTTACYPCRNYSDLIKSHLKACQKQPTIERQLEEIGFTKKVSSYFKGLQYSLHDTVIYLTYVVWDIEIENKIDEFYQAKFLLDIHDIQKILDFAKYLVELKRKKDSTCQ
jgi:hypothetical protein